jgi:hypothetical protein
VWCRGLCKHHAHCRGHVLHSLRTNLFKIIKLQLT